MLFSSQRTANVFKEIDNQIINTTDDHNKLEAAAFEAADLQAALLEKMALISYTLMTNSNFLRLIQQPPLDREALCLSNWTWMEPRSPYHYTSLTLILWIMWVILIVVAHISPWLTLVMLTPYSTLSSRTYLHSTQRTCTSLWCLSLQVRDSSFHWRTTRLAAILGLLFCCHRHKPIPHRGPEAQLLASLTKKLG